MQTRFLPLLCLLGVPAIAQNSTVAKPAADAPQTTVPKGRQQPVERHTRTTWHYHSGPKRNAIPGDSSAMKPAATQNHPPNDAGK